MIPKIIHYCWFGRGKIPDVYQKYIDGWKKLNPDYEIVKWDEDNFDIEGTPYTKIAYGDKKYAYVSDYVRLWALYNYGGIYMDTDVELLMPLDKFLDCSGFTGFEKTRYPITGIMAGEKGFTWYREILDLFYSVGSEQKIDYIVPNTFKITDYMVKKGVIRNGKLQTVDGFTIYPRTYFCPLSYDHTKAFYSKNTYAVHHFAGSWCNGPKKITKMQNIKGLFKEYSVDWATKILGVKLVDKVFDKRHKK